MGKQKNRNTTFRMITLITSVWLFSLLPVYPAVTAKEEYNVKAVLIGTVIVNISWPRESGYYDKTRVLTLGVIGKSPFEKQEKGKTFDWLHSIYAERLVDEKKVKVVGINNLDDIKNCTVLFIARSEEERLKDILEESRKYPILTFSDTENFSRKGIHINMLVKNEKPFFEVDETALNASHMAPSVHLLKAAVIVNPSRKRQ